MHDMVAEPVSQHYVPKLLLREWTYADSMGQSMMNGCYWDPWKGQVRSLYRGTSTFCCLPHAFSKSEGSKDRTVIERDVFSRAETNAKNAHRALLASAPLPLTRHDRKAFSRLLISVFMRQPDLVEHVRTDLIPGVRRQLDQVPLLRMLAAFIAPGKIPSDALQAHVEEPLEDHLLYQFMANALNYPAVFDILMSSQWHVRELPSTAELIFGDRPLITENSSSGPVGLWALPLNRRRALIISPDQQKLGEVLQCDDDTFAEILNGAMIANSMKYAFITGPTRPRWMDEAIRLRHQGNAVY